MVRFCIFGAGQMGNRHARTLAEHPKAEIHSVYDLLPEAAADLAGRHGAVAVSDRETALADPAVDAVVITTPASSHAELVVVAARAGKAIFCEKPLAEDIPTARAAVEEVRKAGVSSFMGFMKRFEPSHLALIQAVKAGEIGDVELVLLTNRDPKVTLLELSQETHQTAPYTLLRESTVHDFDLARALLDDEPVEVYVAASSLVEPELGKLGEVDAAMTTLKTGRGALCHINNIWRTTYGYDQRLEVHGVKGMLRAENRPETGLVRYTAGGVLHDRLHSGPPGGSQFYLHKYAAAYPAEMNHFVESLEEGRRPMVSVEDGYRSQLLVEAAVESLKTNRPVRVAER
ncbi:MAG: Gfo/Idh/MocA family oxidoreductase [Caldilineaceae bacterium]|nr:Gfo/Idh/MocA family oxidoreductase [Caldilineaceae bacterium]